MQLQHQHRQLEGDEKYGDGLNRQQTAFVFFYNDAKEIVASAAIARDTFQMEGDVCAASCCTTSSSERGSPGSERPSVPTEVHVWLLGALPKPRPN